MKTKKVPAIMGIVNITPDSFSDGGAYLDPTAACRYIDQLVESGADIIDLGAESSRPGALSISVAEEWRRIEPVLDYLEKVRPPARISIDTSKPELMLRAVDKGVEIINDINGGVEEAILKRLANYKVTYLAMHKHTTFELMQQSALTATEALRQVSQFYETKQNLLERCGFKSENIWLDPGIGFGKTDAANIQLLAQATKLAATYNLVIGISRKSFLGRTLGIDDPRQRDESSKTMELALMFVGVRAIRTHDVARLNKLRALFLSKE